MPPSEQEHSKEQQDSKLAQEQGIAEGVRPSQIPPPSELDAIRAESLETAENLEALPYSDFSSESTAEPVAMGDVVLRLATLAKRVISDGKNLDKDLVYTDSQTGLSFKMLPDPNGGPKRFEIFSRDQSGNVTSSYFFDAGTGYLLAAKDFSDPGNQPGGRNIPLTSDVLAKALDHLMGKCQVLNLDTDFLSYLSNELFASTNGEGRVSGTYLSPATLRNALWGTGDASEIFRRFLEGHNLAQKVDGRWTLADSIEKKGLVLVGANLPDSEAVKNHELSHFYHSQFNQFKQYVFQYMENLRPDAKLAVMLFLANRGYFPNNVFSSGPGGEFKEILHNEGFAFLKSQFDDLKLTNKEHTPSNLASTILMLRKMNPQLRLASPLPLVQIQGQQCIVFRIQLPHSDQYMFVNRDTLEPSILAFGPKNAMVDIGNSLMYNPQTNRVERKQT